MYLHLPQGEAGFFPSLWQMLLNFFQLDLSWKANEADRQGVLCLSGSVKTTAGQESSRQSVCDGENNNSGSSASKQQQFSNTGLSEDKITQR